MSGEQLGVGGRLIALAGVITPASGGEIRAGVRTATQGVQGVYRFMAKSGKEYIGKSKDVWRRLTEHMRGPNAKLSPDDLGSVRVKEVEGDAATLRHAEQLEIDAAGGIAGGKLENKINAERQP